MRLKNIDLIVIVAIVASNVVWILLPMHIIGVSIILALPLVFLLPGYVVTEALAYKQSLDGVYHALLCLGLSLAIDILGGFVLNTLSIGLRAISWVVLLGLLTGVFSLIVAYIRWKSSIQERQVLSFRLHIHEYIVAMLAIAVVVLSIQYSVTGVTQQPHPGFTQLWMLSPPQNATNCVVRLGVRSFEPTSTTYRITMKENGIQVHIWSSVVLLPNEEWDRVVPIPSTAATSASIEVFLYKADRPEKVYREGHVLCVY